LSAKSPLTCQIVGHLSALDPILVLEDKDKSTLHLTNEVITEKKRLDESVCDSILHEFSNLFDRMLNAKWDYFREYSQEEDRLDPCYSERIGNKSEFANLRSVTKLLFLLSHGQASVEKWISVNTEVSVARLAET